MIKDKSRAGWFGASDTHYIMGNWDTDTFRKWWLVKVGAVKSTFGGNKYTRAGTAYEHRILSHLKIPTWDRQIRFKRYRLRVNLDGEDKICVYEVKTEKEESKSVKKSYWQQAQVEAFATKKRVAIVFYRMTEENYSNYFLPIEDGCIKVHYIGYDKAWIEKEYLPRLKYLCKCLKKGWTPNVSGFERYLTRLAG